MVFVPGRSRSGFADACLGVFLTAAVLMSSGCQEPADRLGLTADEMAAQEVARMPTEPNIVNVVAIYNTGSPWLWDSDNNKIRGIYVAGLFLFGPKKHAVFGDGVIRPRLYVLERGQDGDKHPKLVKEWSFNVEEALPFRGKKKRTLGWGYGLPLPFGDIEVTGREVQMVICFERPDGRIVRSSKQAFLVR